MYKDFEKEIARRFLKELTPQEQYYFLRKVKEAIYIEGYTPDEDLFYYCYFLALKERLKAIMPYRTEGFLRYIFAEGLKEVEDSIKLYKERIDTKRNISDKEITKKSPKP